MKLYHGSRYNLSKLENKQATNGGFVDVPKEELQNGIYLTPNYEFAVAMAIRPDGMTRIDNKKISFEHQELFDPEKEVFIYVFDTEEEQFKNKELEYHNKNEYMIKGVNELIPSQIETIKSKEIFKYYELINWNEFNEIKQEQKVNFKLK